MTGPKTGGRSARDDAANAGERAGLADEKAGQANKAAGDANKRAEELNAKNLDTQKQLLAASQKLEDERKTRLELEQSLAPRDIPITINSVEGTSTFDSLKPFAGIGVTINVLPDAETSRAASVIAGLVQAAGWKILSVNSRPDLNIGFFDGVVVNPAFPNTPEEFLESRPQMAADALVAVLKSNNWEARTMYANRRAAVSPDTVAINVGFKPSPYFLKKEEAGVKQEMEQQEEQDQERKNDLGLPPAK